MNPDLPLPPAWLREALCASPEQDPRTWNADVSRQTTRADLLLTAATACFGCPVQRECALAALEQLPVSVIMGGIPLPNHWWANGGQGARAALYDVAEGRPAHLALAAHCAATSPKAAHLVDTLEGLGMPGTAPTAPMAGAGGRG